MTQIVIPDTWLEKAAERAKSDPLYSHRCFKTPTDIGRTLIEDYAKGTIRSWESFRVQPSELNSLIKNIVKDELAKNGIKTK